MWTSETPSEPGWYLWRFCPPDEPPVVGTFMIYELIDSLRVQEFSKWRETGASGLWDHGDWKYRINNTEHAYQVEFLCIGSLDISVRFIKAFRDLYDAALLVWRDLNWKPDSSEDDSVHFRMLSTALNTIHKEK